MAMKLEALKVVAEEAPKKAVGKMKAKKPAAEPDSLRGISHQIGTTQRRSAWPLRKDDTHISSNWNDTEKISMAPAQG